MIKSAEFFLPGGRSGVLLIHGLTGTPAEMRFVGRGLNHAGFSVLGMQLAGHCGTEDDLLATGWRDWYDSVAQSINRLRGEVDQVFVAGLSMGAVLALAAAQDSKFKISGLALYGTTFFYDGWAIPRIAKLSFLLPAVTRLGIGLRRRFMETHPFGIRDERIRKRLTASMHAGDSAAAGLPGNPWPSLSEFFKLSRHVRNRLSDVDTPCLLLHATEDDVASIRNARVVMRSVRGPAELVPLKNSYHMVTVDQERDQVISRSADFFTRVAADRLKIGS
jgi:carboxylesterase